MGTTYLGNGTGGRSAVVVCAMTVTPGQQFPVVVGAAGSGGAALNVASWNSGSNGGAGGTSSFGSISVAGGGGSGFNTNGTDAAFATQNTGTVAAAQIGSLPGGVPATSYASGKSGSAGYVIVTW